MSFWTYGVEQLAMFNPLTATGKGIYNVYTQIKNTPISSTAWYKDLFGLQATSSAINDAKDAFIEQTGAVADSVGGLGQGVGDLGTGIKEGLSAFGGALLKSTGEYKHMFETGAKYGTLSIALIAGVVALYLLKK
jgi:hypothetical protein